MVKIAASEPLKRVTGRIFRLVSNFIEARKKKFKSKYIKLLKKIFDHISAHTKNTDLILYSLKNTSRDTVPLRRLTEFIKLRRTTFKQ
jgi:hypothetical protein